MITLIGFMTLDSAQTVYFPLILERPELAAVKKSARAHSSFVS